MSHYWIISLGLFNGFMVKFNVANSSKFSKDLWGNDGVSNFFWIPGTSTNKSNFVHLFFYLHCTP